MSGKAFYFPRKSFRLIKEPFRKNKFPGNSQLRGSIPEKCCFVKFGSSFKLQIFRKVRINN